MSNERDSGDDYGVDFSDHAVFESSRKERCDYIPPTPGYAGCTRNRGHEGPCAHTFLDGFEHTTSLWILVGGVSLGLSLGILIVGVIVYYARGH